MIHPTGQIVGHSFVRRMASIMNGENPCKYLKVENHVSNLSIHTNIFFNLLQINCNADFAILDIGSNELANGYTGAQVANRIIGYINEQHSIKVFCIFLISERKLNLRNTSYVQFENEIKVYNERIIQYCKSNNSVCYQYIEGIHYNNNINGALTVSILTPLLVLGNTKLQ